jgi:Fe-S cluster assembly ATP-binding protein
MRYIGRIHYGENLLELEPNERALKGLFLAFQYPTEIPGVAAMTFLKAALNAQRRARGENDLTTPDFMRRVRESAQALKIDQEMLRRPLNVGFSGGEKKRFEVLQMALLAPRVSVLDETDSGLDIDALRVVAEGVNALRDSKRAFVVITHYQRLLDYIKPDVVHVMAKGWIVYAGGPELALALERTGYCDYAEEAARSALMTAHVVSRSAAGKRRFPAIRRAGKAEPPSASRRCLRAVRRGRVADPARRGLALYRFARRDGRCVADPCHPEAGRHRSGA